MYNYEKTCDECYTYINVRKIGVLSYCTLSQNSHSPNKLQSHSSATMRIAFPKFFPV